MNKAEVVKNFLLKAKVHFEAEMRSLAAQSLMAAPDTNPTSRMKAIEGARWTAYHTGTLLKYLEEHGA